MANGVFQLMHVLTMPQVRSALLKASLWGRLTASAAMHQPQVDLQPPIVLVRRRLFVAIV